MNARQLTKNLWVPFALAIISTQPVAFAGKHFTPATPSAPPPARDGVLQGGVLEDELIDSKQSGGTRPKRFPHEVLRTSVFSTQSQVAGIETQVSAAQQKKALYQAFLKMNCQEFTRLNANYYSAERNYKFLGERVAAESSMAIQQPEATIDIKGKRSVRMALPGFKSRTVFLYSDEKHLIAIDPTCSDTWFWQASGTWAKLTHIKK